MMGLVDRLATFSVAVLLACGLGDATAQAATVPATAPPIAAAAPAPAVSSAGSSEQATTLGRLDAIDRKLTDLKAKADRPDYI